MHVGCFGSCCELLYCTHLLAGPKERHSCITGQRHIQEVGFFRVGEHSSILELSQLGAEMGYGVQGLLLAHVSGTHVEAVCKGLERGRR